ncbi:restriction endonuclease subunit S [Paenibacillus sp. GbtcB18]|uniref:restriction endonuclease subunit S n=1 Tax=Paenibacillus sp. GbtcB18 TaxID=2824763 RepID=UPI001C30A198|nr:restriction endonuclease subunit S [Paenibacillus sp. GbtcB18]
MNKYKLGDVVKVISERVDNPANCEYDKFVGLEHYVSGEIEIKNYGNTSLLKSAMKAFKSGDILIARRNVYLKRASIVKFDGITSGDSIVLRVEDKLLRRIIPFVLNTDEFWGYAEKFSDGTMSKRLSPKVLLEYEFVLPQIAQQEKLADLLWAANNTKEAYKKLLYLTDELVKSQYIEMFGNPETNEKGWGKRPLSDTCDIITGNTPPRANAAYYGNFIEWIKSDNITQQRATLSMAAEYLSEEGAKVGRVVSSGSILMTCIAGGLNSIGNIAIVDRDIAFNQQINALVPKSYETWFLYYMLRMMRSSIHEATNKALKCILSKGQLSNVEAIVPPEHQQKQFALFAEQADKSKFKLEQSIVNIEKTIKTLMSKNFG